MLLNEYRGEALTYIFDFEGSNSLKSYIKVLIQHESKIASAVHVFNPELRVESQNRQFIESWIDQTQLVEIVFSKARHLLEIVHGCDMVLSDRNFVDLPAFKLDLFVL